MEKRERKPEKLTFERGLVLAVLLLVAVVSFFYVGDWAMDPDTHAEIIASLDSKVETVLKLTGASTVASAGISAIPGDTATPIAEKLADFSEVFLVILCVLYAEKYALAIIGAATFKILIPAACVLVGISIFSESALWRRLAVKFTVFGLIIFILIPVSIRVSDLIYATYDDSINNTISAAEQMASDTSLIADAQEDSGVIDSILSGISDSVSGLTERAANTLSRFVETLAVMIVTSCIIPLLVVVFFVWVAKILTGVNFMPDLKNSRDIFGHRRRKKSEPPEPEPQG